MADNGTDGPSQDQGQNASDTKAKSKKPSDSAFKQQRLPAWQPVMTAKSVIPSFCVIGLIFIPLGAALFDQSNKVKEIIVDYTSKDACNDCYNNLNTTGAHNDSYVPCSCTLSISLDSDFEAPVYMYYGLDNFYQNHRRYVKSRDDLQLLGKIRTLDGSSALADDCDPYRKENGTNLMYAPCGAIANSLFNDSISLIYHDKAGTTTPVGLIKTGIAWPTDKKSKFKNPTHSGDLCSAEAFKNTVKPPNWKYSLCELDKNNTDNNGYENEDLIVWMRTAALPNFRKLYRRIDHTAIFKSGLPKGNYSLEIIYNYPVKAFDGRKKIILSTVSWIGGKNPFLGIAYITVGSICILLAVFFTVVHFKIGKRAEEIIDVNDRTPYSS